MKAQLLPVLAALISWGPLHAEGAPNSSGQGAILAAIDEILTAADTNQDGLYSEEEIIGLLETLQARRAEAGIAAPQNPRGQRDAAPPSPEEAAARIMSRMDRDRDGLLSPPQIEFVLEKIAKRGL